MGERKPAADGQVPEIFRPLSAKVLPAFAYRSNLGKPLSESAARQHEGQRQAAKILVAQSRKSKP